MTIYHVTEFVERKFLLVTIIDKTEKLGQEIGRQVDKDRYPSRRALDVVSFVGVLKPHDVAVEIFG
jgi:hypothetical protein